MSENQSLIPAHYHAASRFLHWLMAGLVLYMIFQGWSLEEKDSLRATRYMIHKSIGITILVLVIVRIGLRLIYKAPPEIPMPKHQAIAAKAVHFLFYGLMIGLPLSGWATVSTSELARPTILYNLINLPHLPLPKELHDIFEEAHHLGAKLIIYVTVPLHIIAALFHHFKTKDETTGRMIKGLNASENWQSQIRRFWLPILVIVIPLLLATFLVKGEKGEDEKPKLEQSEKPYPEKSISTNVAPSSSSASSVSNQSPVDASNIPMVWKLAPSDVKIGFETAYMGEAIKGDLSVQKAQIIFNPDASDLANIKIIMALKSVKTGDSDRDQTLIGSDFFDTANYPTAIFEAQKVSALGKNSFRAFGHLTLKGKKHPHNLNFTLKISKDRAQMTALTAIDRTVYQIGTGEFADTKSIPAEVKVSISLIANRG